jgi:hypothetical protein
MLRLPLPADLVTRDGTAAQDAQQLNSFVDDGYVYKRPGINSALATDAGTAQGGIFGENLLFTINGDTMHSYNSAFTLQSTFVL